MEQTVYVSRLGDVARLRGLTVADVQRRLEQRGLRVSRGALDRLFSERPLRAVSLDIVVPVLEELDLDLRAAFEPVTRETAKRQAQERAEAASLVRRFPRAAGRAARRQEVRQAGVELEEVTDRLEERLRQRHPELFDRRGRLRRRALTRLLAARTGKQFLAEADILALAPASPPRAPAPHGR